MPEVIFRGAVLSHADVRSGEGGLFVRCHIEADYTDVLREQLSGANWQPLPDSQSKGTLIGEIVGCDRVNFNPNGMSNLGMVMSCISCKKFTLHRVKYGENSTQVKVRFQLVSNDHLAAAKIGEYKDKVGDTVSEIRVVYAAQQATAPALQPNSQQNLEGIVTEVAKKRAGRPSRKDQLADAAAAEGSVEVDEEERQKIGKVLQMKDASGELTH